jgi:succinate dehydrogenase / fumarate reductase flavoprotein subunit
MRIFPALHYTMGGLWVDYHLMSTIPGLFVLGEANFSDHGANRLGASALMQGLADGYFVIPYAMGNYLGGTDLPAVNGSEQPFQDAVSASSEHIGKVLGIGGERPVVDLHRELGLLLWENCGMARNEAGLKQAKARIPELREEFWKNARILGREDDLNQGLEHALRVADYLEFAELMVEDALQRAESCGGHFREESQTDENEAKRDDENFAYAAAWEFQGVGKAPTLHKEPLEFDYVKPSQRSYK